MDDETLVSALTKLRDGMAVVVLDEAAQYLARLDELLTTLSQHELTMTPEQLRMARDLAYSAAKLSLEVEDFQETFK